MTDLKLPAVVHQHIDQQTRRLALGAAALAIVISFSALFLAARAPEPPVFISVSMKSLVEDHMLATVGRDISHYEAELRTREFSHALDLAIAELAGEDGVMVLASEAVVGSNVLDFTEDIRVRTRVIARELAARRGETLPPPGDVSGIENVFGDIEAEMDTLALRINPDAIPGVEGAE